MVVSTELRMDLVTSSPILMERAMKWGFVQQSCRVMQTDRSSANRLDKAMTKFPKHPKLFCLIKIYPLG